MLFLVVRSRLSVGCRDPDDLLVCESRLSHRVIRASRRRGPSTYSRTRGRGHQPPAMPMLRRCVIFPIAFPVLFQAQAPEIRRLSPPTGELPEQFTSLTSVRELPDGRVLVTDRRGGRLAVVDFAAGSARTVGRRAVGASPKYQLLNGDCGVILIWTR